ncbi:helical backbone metal receptor, partial [Hydrotalea sp.]
FKNVFENFNRYPEVTAEQIKAAQPQLILLSSEPYPFREKHVHYFQTLVPAALVLQVDGEMFSWYGSRLLKSAPYFQALIQQLQKNR